MVSKYVIELDDKPMTIRELFIRLGVDPPADLPEDESEAKIRAVAVIPEEGRLRITMATTRKALSAAQKKRLGDRLRGVIENVKDVHFESRCIDGLPIHEYLARHYEELVAEAKRKLGLNGVWLDHSSWEYRPGTGLEIAVLHDMARESLRRAKAERIIAEIVRGKTGNDVKVAFVRGKGELALPPVVSTQEAATGEIAVVAQPPGTAFREEQFLGKNYGGQPLKMAELQFARNGVLVEGKVVKVDTRDVAGGCLIDVFLTDHSDSVEVKFFESHKKKIKIAHRLAKLPERSWLRVHGDWAEDTRHRSEMVLRPDSIRRIADRVRLDTAARKRVELHCHSQFSRMDATLALADLVERAKLWGHEALAITDHGVVQAFPEFATLCKRQGIKPVYGLEGYLVEEFIANRRAAKPYHIILLVKEQRGIQNLYRLISRAHMDTHYRHALLVRGDLKRRREGILLGSACERGELYQLLLSGCEREELEKRAAFYDYIEIQPLDNNDFLIGEGRVANRQELQKLNRQLYELGRALGKPVIATGDSHYLDPEDGIFRRVLMDGMNFDDVERKPSLFLRTTGEMLEEFAYLGKAAAAEVVIDNPQRLCAMIEDTRPMPEEFCPPIMPGADEELAQKSRAGAAELYGRPLPSLVEERLEREITAITEHNYSSIFLIASRLVRQSISDGYIVGSRGSVGSSFVARVLQVTEVNPLPPHYLCLSCRLSEFSDKAAAGVDLPEKKCPRCKQAMVRDGFDIPFEVFMGFRGEKVPDIDLNFSGEYQARALRNAEEIFGARSAYRAGTISGVQNRLAYGLVMKHFEKRKRLDPRRAEIERLVKGCSGVKKTTGQHPGGVMFVPEGMDIYDFTPIQYPADNRKGDIITTHFDCEAIHDIMMKLDILGHDNPTSLRNLCAATGLKVEEIPLQDPDTMAIFSGWGKIEVDAARDDLPAVGTLGIPEYGTEFVIKMLEESKPGTFNDLICVSGLSHGTNVWLYNAQELVRGGKADLSTVISVRDNIMLYLTKQGLPKQEAFNIMEAVRKGRGLSSEQEKLMSKHGTPDWYLESCKKITYMFPKAHAVAYVMMAFKIAYFKVHHPETFYADCFSNSVGSFDLANMCQGREPLRRFVRELDLLAEEKRKLSPKDSALLGTAKIVREMYSRGLGFLPVDLYKSSPRRFTVEDGRLRPPLSVLKGVAESTANAIARERKGEPFKSVENLGRRTGANRTVVAALRENGCLKGLPETNQGTLF